MTVKEAFGLLIEAETDAELALAAYQRASSALAIAQARLYEEVETEHGTRFVPLKRLAAEILESANVPDSAMPGGRGGNADERKAARTRWCMENLPEYARLIRQIEDAEFSVSIAQGTLATTERSTARFNAKFGAVKAALELLTAQINVDGIRENIKLVQLQNPFSTRDAIPLPTRQ